MNKEITEVSKRCYHCGEECKDSRNIVEDKIFCCSGCKLVYELLNENNLCTYYNLNQYPGGQSQQSRRKDKFAYLDKQEIAASIITFSDEAQAHVTFSVPQMHCSSCLWLLEHLNSIDAGILTTRVNFTKKEVFVVYDVTKASLRSVVETMAAVGYEPYLSLNNTAATRPSKKYNRITEIAVAGFCFANIMMLSLPEYFSVSSYLQEAIGKAFRYIGLLMPSVQSKINTSI